MLMLSLLVSDSAHECICGPIVSMTSEYDIDVDDVYISKYSEHFLKTVHAMWVSVSVIYTTWNLIT